MACKKIDASKLRDRNLPRARTGVSPFLLLRFVTDRSSLSKVEIAFVQDRIKANPHAKKQYERIKDELGEPVSEE